MVCYGLIRTVFFNYLSMTIEYKRKLCSGVKHSGSKISDFEGLKSEHTD